VLVGALSDSITNRLLSGRGHLRRHYLVFALPTSLRGTADRSARQVLESYTFTAGAINFVASFAVAIVIATGVYWLVDRRIIRAMAGRLLGIRRAPLTMAQGSPAE